MLKIKSFENFKGGPKLVIVGAAEDYLRASAYLSGKESATLNDKNFATYYETKLTSPSQLCINKKECADLAEIFLHFGSDPGGYHDYYDTEALGAEMELLISIGEYPDSLFEEEDDE
jgi:hypothetical protein